MSEVKKATMEVANITTEEVLGNILSNLEETINEGLDFWTAFDPDSVLYWVRELVEAEAGDFVEHPVFDPLDEPGDIVEALREVLGGLDDIEPDTYEPGLDRISEAISGLLSVIESWPSYSIQEELEWAVEWMERENIPLERVQASPVLVCDWGMGWPDIYVLLALEDTHGGFIPPMEYLDVIA